MGYNDLCILSISKFCMYFEPKNQINFIVNYVGVIVEYDKDIMHYILDFVFEIKNSSIVEII